MPIKGLTDRHARFPEIGRIRKGAPKVVDAQGKTVGIGRDLPYFRVEFDAEETEAQAVFERHYGTEPDAIDILLPFETPGENFEAWREAYLAGGMVHRCDGEHVVYEWDPQRGRPQVKDGIDVDTGMPKACDGTTPILKYGRNHDQGLFCKPTGRLKVLLPVLHRAAYMTVLTGSIYDIVHLTEQLEAYRMMGPRGLIGIPLVLRRRPKSISRPDPKTGERKRMTKSLLSIEADPTWVEQQVVSLQRATMPAIEAGAVMLLPASRAVYDEGPDDGQDDESEIDGELVEPEPTPGISESGSSAIDAPAKPRPAAEWPGDIVGTLLAERDLLPKGATPKSVRTLLRFSPFRPGDPIEWVAGWVAKYMAVRARAAQDGQNMPAIEAAQAATKAWVNVQAERLDAKDHDADEWQAWTTVLSEAERMGLIDPATAQVESEGEE